MKKRASQFAKQVCSTLGPTLSRCGFALVHLESCIQPEILYRRGRLWFGASYDVRDQWLELELGHLYWFRDVMPRVIILGDLSEYGIQFLSDGASNEQIQNGLMGTAENFERALAKYSDEYPAILHRHLHPPKGKYVKEFLSHLQTEVQEAELEEYIE